ncbi:MAG: alpha/beta hydrolase [Chloroflexi bacterium]|nr:alpha/beta hydrolase [Chloroflexota bacterium]
MSEPPIIIQPIDGLQTATCALGEGRPVLTLHGWGASLRHFWPVAERLAPNGYQFHLLDLPGFGQTQLPSVPWSVADYMRFVLAYLDHCDLQRVSILGHSFGGRVALMLAAEHPDRVQKMVLADSAGIRTPPSLKQQMRALLARTVRGSLDMLKLDGVRTRLQASYNRRYASTDYLTAGPLRETFLRVIEEDLSAFARRIQAPTLLIWGDQDADTPLWQGRQLEQLIPDAGLVIYQGAGHFSYLERLDDYVRVVDHFLSNRS